MPECIHCKKEFEKNGSSFCSKQCFLLSKRVDKQCDECNETFSVLRCHDDRKFCSRKCYYSCYRGRRNSDSVVRINCDQCGKDNDVYRSQFREKSNHFCDRKCYLLFHRREYNECEVCSTKTPNKHFCSRNCYKLAFVPKNFSKNHKRGKYKTKDGREIRYDSSWELRRMKELDYSSSVVSWKRCALKIKWEDSSGIPHFYNPDFEIEYRNGQKVIEEVKGYYNDDTQRKIDAAKEYLEGSEVEYRVTNLDDFDMKIEVHTEEYQNSYGIFTRPSLYYVWMNFALLLEKRSTCLRNKVGAVFVDKDMSKALCLGYNGNYSGGENQCESLEPGKCQCIHAETNSLTKSKDDIDGSILFVTVAPCHSCAKLLINRKISKVVYQRVYRSTQGIAILRKSGIEVFKFNDIMEFVE